MMELQTVYLQNEAIRSSSNVRNNDKTGKETRSGPVSEQVLPQRLKCTGMRDSVKV